MEGQFWDEALECMPLPGLLELAERTFVERRVMERASQSALYRDRWAAAGIRPADVRTYADLSDVPYTTGEDLRSAQAQHHPDEIVCSDHVRLWISTSGTTGAPKWIPLSDADLDLQAEVAKRHAFFTREGLRQGNAVFGLSSPAPFVTDSSAYVGAVNEMLWDHHNESIIVTFTEASDGLGFALKRRINGLAAFPSLAMRVAEGIAESSPVLARERLKERFSLVNLLAFVVTRFKTIRPKDLTRFEIGIFAGEPLEPYREAIAEAYDMESHEAYAFSEFLCPSVECWAHDGFHVWMDIRMPEIIPVDELDKERADPSYVPQASPLWEAPAGLVGEYVTTTFGEAFPLVRYRTSDLIRVVSTDPCACGRTHPRIRVLHRTDDIVNLGIVRFSIFALQDELAQVAGIARWELRITREGYKPKAVLVIEPVKGASRDRVSQEALSAALELEVIRLGLENGLIAPPEVELVRGLEERRTRTGKLRHVIYEDV